MSVFSVCLDNRVRYDILDIQKEAMAMTNVSRVILENYQVRKTKKQKQAFISLMQDEAVWYQ